MANTTLETKSGSNNSFAVKNPSNGKIVAFVNFSKNVNESVASSITAEQLVQLLDQCTLERFIKAEAGEALDGLSIS